MLKWIGTHKGVQGLPGIPARDLSQVEVVRYGGEKALLGTGLYERVAVEKPTKPAKAEIAHDDD